MLLISVVGTHALLLDEREDVVVFQEHFGNLDVTTAILHAIILDESTKSRCRLHFRAFRNRRRVCCTRVQKSGNISARTAFFDGPVFVAEVGRDSVFVLP